MTKKEFFANYGIEYRTKDSKILAPWGQWVPMPLTWGSKTHCYGWSTLAGTKEWEVEFNGKTQIMKGTCNCQCDHCYGCTGHYRKKSVINANGWRTYAARYHMDWLKRAITAQINWGVRRKPYESVRAHITGDFHNMEYVDMWKGVKAECLETRMWSYTKNKEAEDAFDDIDGFNIVKSLVPGFGINYGHCDYVMAMYRALREAGIETHICRCAVDEEQHCNTCHACQDLKYVLFLEHGSKYNPKADPLWDEFVALVESDENKRHI